ncbi:WD40 repeat [Macleaya cordata]|uniref:WD40 repeat n=1 Tax=Macleaya cordata TaxID=56857 RepID=A0A200PVL4_MACCD|nr:WD40 repeat [Macleaya cordata]
MPTTINGRNVTRSLEQAALKPCEINPPSVMPMDDKSSELLGPKGLIKRHEFVRLIIQCLYSLGYNKSASLLESESGISCKSSEFILLESQIHNLNWDDCIVTINTIEEMNEETRNTALFLIYKQCILEFLTSGDDFSALKILRKRISVLGIDREKVHKLACGIVSLDEMELGKLDDSYLSDLRRKLLIELERLLPPPITLPERRLEHLVEMAVTAQRDSCIYHNSSEAISLYEDHCCGRDQIPNETVQILSHHENEVWFVQFSNNGDYLASSSSDCTAIIWKVSEEGIVSLKHTLRSHQNPVSFVAWSPDDRMLLTCGNGEVLKLWDVETGICKHTFGDRSPVVNSCAWFPDSKRLVCGSSDPNKCIYMWDLDGNELEAWRGVRVPKVTDLAVTPDGEHLISICFEKDIRIYNFQTKTERIIKEEHVITSLSVSKDSEFFIINLNSQEIHMHDIAGNWKKPLRYMGHKQGKYVIRSCFGGSNCMFIASGSEDSKIYIWNRRNCEPVEVLSGHLMNVNCVSWNPKRPYMLASASDDQTIRIWGPSGRKNA